MRKTGSIGTTGTGEPLRWYRLEMPAVKALVILVITGCIVALAALVRPDPHHAPLSLLLFLPLIAALFLCRFAIVLALGIALSLVTLWLGMPPGQAFWPLEPLSTPVIQATLCLLIALGGGLAVQRMRSQQHRLTMRLEDTDTRDNVMRWVEASDSLEDAVDIVLLALEHTHPSHASILYLLDETRTQLVPEGMQGQVSTHVQTRMPESVDAWGGEDALSTPHLIPGDSTPFTTPFYTLVPDAVSGLVFPLFQADCRLAGILVLAYSRPEEVSLQDMERLRGIVKEVSLALERIRLRENLHGMAFSDALTGLKNYRAFRQDLQEELRRAERYSHPLSLLVLDLDLFKQINDRYGHPAGNQVLKHIAGILRGCVRDTDLPARYGGEEFVTLCPETGESEAQVVAERIRRAVQNSPYPILDSESLPVTISVGVATFPVHAESEMNLLAMADAALYRAKEAGRNQVVLASALTPLREPF